MVCFDLWWILWSKKAKSQWLLTAFLAKWDAKWDILSCKFNLPCDRFPLSHIVCTLCIFGFQGCVEGFCSCSMQPNFCFLCTKCPKILSILFHEAVRMHFMVVWWLWLIYDWVSRGPQSHGAGFSTIKKIFVNKKVWGSLQDWLFPTWRVGSVTSTWF